MGNFLRHAITGDKHTLLILCFRSGRCSGKFCRIARIKMLDLARFGFVGTVIKQTRQHWFDAIRLITKAFPDMIQLHRKRL